MPRGGARPGSGRKPGPLSQAKKDITDEAQKWGPQMMKVLVDIAQNAKAPTAARVSAADSVLNRAYGRPAQDMTLKGDKEAPVVHEHQFDAKQMANLTDEQLEALAAVAAMTEGDGDPE